MVASLSSYDGVESLIARPSDSKNLLNILFLLTPLKNDLISEQFVYKATPVYLQLAMQMLHHYIHVQHL